MIGKTNTEITFISKFTEHFRTFRNKNNTSQATVYTIEY